MKNNDDSRIFWDNGDGLIDDCADGEMFHSDGGIITSGDESDVATIAGK